MLARKIILGFGFAALLPMLIHYGIEFVSPRPEYRQYQIENYYERHKQASPDEQKQLEAEKTGLDAQHRTAQDLWEQIHFFVGVPVGIVVTLLGSFIRVQAIGGGLMLGGIFTFTKGCAWYWLDLPRGGRFLVLLVAFGVLLWIGYQRLSELKQPSKSP
jgi:hypothetical protein